MDLKTKPVLAPNVNIIEGTYHPYKDFVKDVKGYFLIRVNRREKMIELGYCKKNNLITIVIKGKNPQDIYFEAIERKIISRLDHAAYLGKELEKAYLCLKRKTEYIQDKELV